MRLGILFFISVSKINAAPNIEPQAARIQASGTLVPAHPFSAGPKTLYNFTSQV